MEQKIGVVNPNGFQQIPDVNMELFYYSLFSGLIMGLLVTAVIIWIMKSAFQTRTNAASIVASFFLSGFIFTVYVTVIMIFSKDIWIISSVMLWTATFMGSLWFFQPPSLEQLVAKTHSDVAKLEKRLEKQKKQDAAREVKENAKAARKLEKARSKGVVIKTPTTTTTNDSTEKDLN